MTNMETMRQMLKASNIEFEEGNWLNGQSYIRVTGYGYFGFYTDLVFENEKLIEVNAWE